MPRSRQHAGGCPLIVVSVETIAGALTACFSECGLVRLDFPNDAVATTTERPPPNLFIWAQLTSEAIHSVLDGKEPRAAPPLDLRAATSFRRRVWTALRQIPIGSVKTYSEVASAIGSPAAVRAVGGACSANPVPLFIPCHRVVASGGNLGGFSGGLDWKRRLLAVEGTMVANSLDPGAQSEMIFRRV